MKNGLPIGDMSYQRNLQSLLPNRRRLARWILYETVQIVHCWKSSRPKSSLDQSSNDLIGTQHSLLAAICDPTRVVMTITPEGLNLIHDAMTDLGMEHSVVASGATKQYWID
jgi:hypothetical protein